MKRAADKLAAFVAARGRAAEDGAREESGHDERGAHGGEELKEGARGERAHARIRVDQPLRQMRHHRVER